MLVSILRVQGFRAGWHRLLHVNWRVSMDVGSSSMLAGLVGSGDFTSAIGVCQAADEGIYVVAGQSIDFPGMRSSSEVVLSSEASGSFGGKSSRASMVNCPPLRSIFRSSRWMPPCLLKTAIVTRAIDVAHATVNAIGSVTIESSMVFLLLFFFTPPAWMLCLHLCGLSIVRKLTLRLKTN